MTTVTIHLPCPACVGAGYVDGPARASCDGCGGRVSHLHTAAGSSGEGDFCDSCRGIPAGECLDGDVACARCTDGEAPVDCRIEVSPAEPDVGWPGGVESCEVLGDDGVRRAATEDEEVAVLRAIEEADDDDCDDAGDDAHPRSELEE